MLVSVFQCYWNDKSCPAPCLAHYVLQSVITTVLSTCHAVVQVCCGSGLQRIYEFLQTDEHCARPDLDLTMIKVSLPSSGMHGCLLADMLARN